MSKICHNCHTELADNAMYCSECGAKQEENTKDNVDINGKKNKKLIITLITVLVLVAIVAGGFAVNHYIIAPNNLYSEAMALYDAGKYDEALKMFMELNGFSDSELYVEKCNTAIETAKKAEAEKKEKYDTAVSLMKEYEYDHAIALFKELGDYQDSPNQINEAEEAKKNWGKIGTITDKHYAVTSEDGTGFMGFTFTIDKVNGATGYQTRYCWNKGDYSEIETHKGSNLNFYTEGQDYPLYYEFRAYRENEYGDTLYGPWKKISSSYTNYIDVTPEEWNSINSKFTYLYCPFV